MEGLGGAGEPAFVDDGQQGTQKLHFDVALQGCPTRSVETDRGGRHSDGRGRTGGNTFPDVRGRQNTGPPEHPRSRTGTRLILTPLAGFIQ
ncbi:hypothetical protein GCM10010236_21300 [Streptomyces eurythermus]|nr:hypothetical protein GCM10010236_21300 [Streptomyces eurythermus]